jgi:hypothetical protein
MYDTPLDLRPVIDPVAAIADRAHLLSEHLRERWPVQGRGQPPADPPTTITFSDLYRYLLDLKTLLFRLRTPTQIPEVTVWMRFISPVLKVPGVADALKQIDLARDHLINQFGNWESFSDIDGQFKAVLMPTLEAAQPWQPANGQPMPKIDPQDIGALERGAARVAQALGGWLSSTIRLFSWRRERSSPLASCRFPVASLLSSRGFFHRR